MTHDLVCRVSVNLLLEVAFRLYSYDKLALAQVLLHVVLEEYPEHERARNMYEMMTGKSPVFPIERYNRIFYDSAQNAYVLFDKISGVSRLFKTFDEAEDYFRSQA